MTRFIIDDRGSWSGGGHAFLENARLASIRHPETLSVGNPTYSDAIQVTPRNIPKDPLIRRSPLILIPQNAWAWHGPTQTPKSFAHRTALRIGSDWYIRKSIGFIRIGPMIPKQGRYHPKLLPNVLDTSFDAALMQSKRLQPEEYADYILGVGSLNDYRNFETLLAAYAQYRHYGGTRRLHIIGGGERAYSRRLKSAPNVSFHGALSRAETLTWMRNSALTVLPSLVEASPMTLLEALAVQAPVAFSNIPGHNYMTNNSGPHRTFSPKDVRSLSELLAENHQRPHGYLSNEASRRKAREKWSDLLVSQLTEMASPDN